MAAKRFEALHRSVELLDEVALQEAERWLPSDDAGEIGVTTGLTALVDASRSAINAARDAAKAAREKALDEARVLAQAEKRKKR